MTQRKHEGLERRLQLAIREEVNAKLRQGFDIVDRESGLYMRRSVQVISIEQSGERVLVKHV